MKAKDWELPKYDDSWYYYKDKDDNQDEIEINYDGDNNVYFVTGPSIDGNSWMTDEEMKKREVENYLSKRGAKLLRRDSLKKDSMKVKVTLNGKVYSGDYNGMSRNHPDMADVFIDALVDYRGEKNTPKDDMGNSPKDGKYYIKIDRLKKDNPNIRFNDSNMKDSYVKETKQGFPIIAKYVDGGRIHVIAKRASDYVVGLGYDINSGTWAQGRYNLSTFEKAENALFEEKGRVRRYDSIKDGYPSWLPNMLREGKARLGRDTNWDSLLEYVYGNTRGFGKNQISWWINDFKTEQPSFIQDSMKKYKIDNRVITADSPTKALEIYKLLDSKVEDYYDGEIIKIGNVEYILHKKYGNWMLDERKTHDRVADFDDLIEAQHALNAWIKAGRIYELNDSCEDSIKDSTLCLYGNHMFSKGVAEDMADGYNLKVTTDAYCNEFKGKRKDIEEMLDDYLSPSEARELKKKITG